MLALRLLRYVKAHLHTRSEVAEHFVSNEQPFDKPGPEIVVKALWAILARGGFVDDFGSANFPALLGEKHYVMIVKTRDVSHIIHTCECRDSDRGGVWGSYRCFGFETPATCDRVDAHGIGGEESGRGEERLESLLKALGVVLVEDDEGVGEVIEIGDRRERHWIDHSEESLEILGGILYVYDWEIAFNPCSRLG